MNTPVHGKSVVMTAAALLLTVALLIIIFDRPLKESRNRNAGRAFQRSVCGLGIGSALRPDWGFAGYDPRVDAVDETRLWPVPGGYSYSPERGMMGDDSVETF
jgi:hypothetical protein